MEGQSEDNKLNQLNKHTIKLGFWICYAIGIVALPGVAIIGLMLAGAIPTPEHFFARLVTIGGALIFITLGVLMLVKTLFPK